MLSKTTSGRILPVLLCGAWLAGSAHADTRTFSQTLPLQNTNWTSAVSLQKFDPNQGILQSVKLQLDAHIEGTAQFEELGQAPQQVTTTLSVKIEVFRRDMSTIMLVEPSVVHIDNVTAFDGIQDFGGTSGKTYPNLSQDASQTNTAVPPSPDLALFTGPAGNPGSIVLPVKATGTSVATGSGNIISGFTTKASAKVTVIYTFAPDCQPNGVADNVDIQNGTSNDCDHNGVPDECQPDCDHDGLIDACELDCDHDGVPDDCDTPCPECQSLNRRLPGSLLLFPEFDNRAGNLTLITVTNTNCDMASGPIEVEFVYIGRYGQNHSDLGCLEFNRTRTLTPCDTITIWTSADSPQMQQGYVYAFAKDRFTHKAVVFNHLIGEELLISPTNQLDDGINALVFKGIGPDGTLTDHDLDGIRDLDGIEYEEAPAELLIPRFLGQDYAPVVNGKEGPGANPFFHSRLILIALSGGTAFTTKLDFLVYNDNEEVFSTQYTFFCWDDPDLLTIDGVFGNTFLKSTGHALNEIVGEPSRESGWIRINGLLAQSAVTVIHDPAFYAVLVERSNSFSVADLPFELCTQNNGDLLPHSVNGDGL